MAANNSQVASAEGLCAGLWLVELVLYEDENAIPSRITAGLPSTREDLLIGPVA